MKQNRSNKQISSPKGRAAGEKMWLGMIIAVILALVIFSVPESFAKEPAKAKVEPTKKKTELTSHKAKVLSEEFKEPAKKEQTKPKTKVIAPGHDQPAVEIIPVKPQQTEVQPAPAAPTAGEQIKWKVISSGGLYGSSSSYQMTNTVSQTAIGYGSSVSYQINPGFWQEFDEGFIRGDANGDGIINVGDIVYLVSYLYKNGPAPDPVWVGDCNCDEIVNVGDIVFLVSYLYKGGPEPVC